MKQEITKPENLIDVPRPIVKGSIVHYRDGWMRVSARYSNSVNLTGVFGSKPVYKRVPLNEVYEDEAAWFAHWQESETYKCM